MWSFQGYCKFCLAQSKIIKPQAWVAFILGYEANQSNSLWRRAIAQNVAVFESFTVANLPCVRNSHAHFPSSLKVFTMTIKPPKRILAAALRWTS